MVRVYYRAGKHYMGLKEKCGDVVSRDEARKKFKERLKNDTEFREKTLRWTKNSVDKYLTDYDERGRVGGPNIHDSDTSMISSLYLLGDLVKKEGKTAIVTIRDGSKKEFQTCHVCPYDPSHDCETKDLVDDVCAIKGFGEASLLKIMRRRLVEKLSIYTYVGDIVLCLNPYMYLPAMVDVKEYPDHVQFKLGQNPHSYASAHFAYWGALKPELYPGQPERNQSCVVSGESGAGKTVACGFIMKYLKKLSDWRKIELKENESKESGSDITSLVAGVSPFLEAFGNAKTNMNDNSSRFGKFTKIWFSDGKIIGAEFEHYLLEKARLVDQGQGERNYHIFYFLIRGATEEEIKSLQLSKCEDFPKLMGGGSSLIGHGNGPEYDKDRMNSPLHENPDDTGVRAALTAAKVSDETQAQLWRSVAACLHMLTLEFVPTKGGQASQPKNQAKCDMVKNLLSLKDNLGAMLVIYRLKLPGKVVDRDCDPIKSEDNRNALAKDIYDRAFAWLILEICNGVLQPKQEGDAFVGLLDIFGFELMPKNSIEQLCINFANEKLQQLFNRHVFDDEEKAYSSEGLDASVVPPHKDNTPCCNLVEKKTKKYMGMLPILDDHSKSDSNTDKTFVAMVNKTFGKSKGTFKKAQGKIARSASAYYQGDRKKDLVFHIAHYAGDVKYDATNFLLKNKDKLPPQLMELMQGSTDSFVLNLYENKKKHHKSKKLNSLASIYLDQLGRLSKTLKSTTPHYVRCVKPNDIHFRPVDGNASFNAWKTYRQLLYAGVMEVVKIKNEGYPFREKIDDFWSKRCVMNGYHKILRLDSSMDPREGCEAVANAVLPKPHKRKDGIEMFYWTLGNTIFFGKNDVGDRLKSWHEKIIAVTVRKWFRFWALRNRIREFDRATCYISSTYQKVLVKRKYASMETSVMRAQNELNCVEAVKSYRRNAAIHRVCFTLQKTWRSYHAALEFSNIYHAWRHRKLLENMDRVNRYVLSKVQGQLAGKVMIIKIKDALLELRCKIRIQSILRRVLAISSLRRGQHVLAIVRESVEKVDSTHEMVRTRTLVRGYTIAVLRLQSHFRMIQDRSRYRALKSRYVCILRWWRSIRMRCVMLNRISVVSRLQSQLRYIALYRLVTKQKRMALKIKKIVKRYVTNRSLMLWQYEMRGASKQGDVKILEQLMKLEGRFRRIKDRWSLRWLLMIPETYTMNTYVHYAAQSGNLDAVKFLWSQGCPTCGHNLCMETPLHIAAACGDISLNIVKFLLRRHRHARDVLASTNSDGLTVLDIAETSSEPSAKLIAWLKEQGARRPPSMRNLLEKQHTRRVGGDEDLVEIKVNRLRRTRRQSIVRQRMEDFSMKLLNLGESIEDDPHTSRVRKHKMWSSTLVLQKAIRRFISRLKISHLRRESKRKELHNQLVHRLQAMMKIKKNDRGDDDEEEEVVEEEEQQEGQHKSSVWRRGSTAQGEVYFYNSNTYETTSFRPADYDDGDDDVSALEDKHEVLVEKKTMNNNEEEKKDILHAIKAKIEKGHALKIHVSKLRQKLRVLTNIFHRSTSLMSFGEEEEEEEESEVDDVFVQNDDDDDDDLEFQIESEHQAYAECAKLVATGRHDLIDKLSVHAERIHRLEEYLSLSWKKKKQTSSWCYMDTENKVYGPFTGKKMQRWFEEGYFHADTAVRQEGGSLDFEMLRDLFPDGRVLF